jgi:hypothetical protein
VFRLTLPLRSGDRLTSSPLRLVPGPEPQTEPEPGQGPAPEARDDAAPAGARPAPDAPAEVAR